MSLTQLEAINRAVSMTAQCKEVSCDWRLPKGIQCSAILWCNTIGTYVVGTGGTLWEAVQAAHALDAMERNKNSL